MVAYKDSRERKSSEDPHSVVILANKKNPALPGLDFSFSTFTFSSRRCAGIKVQSSLREQAAQHHPRISSKPFKLATEHYNRGTK